MMEYEINSTILLSIFITLWKEIVLVLYLHDQLKHLQRMWFQKLIIYSQLIIHLC